MWVLINFRVYFNIFSSINCQFIEMKTFEKSRYFGLGLSIKQQRTWDANSAPIVVPTPTCQLPYLAWRDSKTWYPAHFADNLRKVFPTAIERSPPSGFFSAISYAPKKYGRSSKGTFHSLCMITFVWFVVLWGKSVHFSVRLGSQVFQKLARKSIQTCTRAEPANNLVKNASQIFSNFL